MTVGIPGKFNLNPSAARSTCAALCVAAALTFGSRWLSSCHLAPRAASELSLASSNPRLFFSARSIASLNDNCSTSPVALPSGRLLRNEFCVEFAGAALVDVFELSSPELWLDEYPPDCDCSCARAGPDMTQRAGQRQITTAKADRAICQAGFIVL